MDGHGLEGRNRHHGRRGQRLSPFFFFFFFFHCSFTFSSSSPFLAHTGCFGGLFSLSPDSFTVVVIGQQAERQAHTVKALELILLWYSVTGNGQRCVCCMLSFLGSSLPFRFSLQPSSLFPVSLSLSSVVYFPTVWTNVWCVRVTDHRKPLV